MGFYLPVFEQSKIRETELGCIFQKKNAREGVNHGSSNHEEPA